MNDLSGRVAVVTGGTSGIGAACAKRFALAGAKVVLVGRNEDKGRLVADEITKQGKCAEFISMDVTSDESIAGFAREVEEKYGRVDILFNNAGVFPVGPALEGIEREFCNEMFNVNITSMIMVTKSFLPFLQSSRGNVLNNASVAGQQYFASGQSYAYAASKSAVIQFTRMLAKRYGSQIRVNCICPGIVKTPLYKTFNEENFASRIPMGRVGSPEDIARAANFLVSDDASYVNGIIMTVDGGLTL